MWVTDSSQLSKVGHKFFATFEGVEKQNSPSPQHMLIDWSLIIYMYINTCITLTGYLPTHFILPYCRGENATFSGKRPSSNFGKSYILSSHILCQKLGENGLFLKFCPKKVHTPLNRVRKKYPRHP